MYMLPSLQLMPFSDVEAVTEPSNAPRLPWDGRRQAEERKKEAEAGKAHREAIVEKVETSLALALEETRELGVGDVSEESDDETQEEGDAMSVGRSRDVGSSEVSCRSCQAPCFLRPLLKMCAVCD